MDEDIAIGLEHIEKNLDKIDNRLLTISNHLEKLVDVLEEKFMR